MHNVIHRVARVFGLALVLGVLLPAPAPVAAQVAPQAGSDAESALFRSALIPKREVGADVFLKANPGWDGRGVVIAIFDTGVDPAAAGLAVTTTGQRKVIDILDGTGTGDVHTGTKRKLNAGGQLQGLSGRLLSLPDGVQNPSGEYRLGLKPASELFYGEVLKRLNDQRAAVRAAAASVRAAARARGADAALLKAAQAKAPEDRSRAERDAVVRDAALVALDAGKAGEDPGALYDCVVWHDGSGWRVLIDTNEDGDLRNERVLRPFGEAGEWASFGDLTFANFGVQVYEGGDVLSIVTVSGDHGTHVASIAAGHFADERGRDGIAPGARILSIKIGDIRFGGGSDQTGELRAAAAVARYKADIVNASWGGRSLYQDGRNANSRLYDRLVERYDVLAVLSAGNDGPALGTAGSAGAEARRVLGVGAYLSPEMGKVLYNSLLPSRAGAQAFTSRGPTKDGDFGVDVAAPGAALAAVSTETLQRGGLKNGTSMASPSAAGVAALVLSAARQSQLDASPARLRAALILGAAPLPQEDALARGAGLINASGAWKKLVELQRMPAFAGFYDLEVDRGTFTNQGRGLLLRESITEPRRRVNVRVTPTWAESVPAAARASFEADLQFKPSVPWITAPDRVHLTNGPKNLAVIVDAPQVPPGAIGSVHVARIDALLAGKPGLGPVFSVPVTIIQPAPAAAFKNHQLEAALKLQPAVTQRQFVQAPPNATRLRIWVKHRAADSLVRSFFVQAAGYAAQTHVAEMTALRNLALEPGAERSFDLVLKPGTVAEVAYTLNFAASGEATLETRLEWLGAGLGTQPIAMPANIGWATVDLRPYADREVKVEARVERAVHTFLPDSTALRQLDERAEYPASPLSPGPHRVPLLRQRFKLELKAPLTVQVMSATDYYAFDAAGGGRVTVVHESGELLFDSYGSNESSRPSFTLPKGKSTVIREFTAANADVLGTLTHTPLRLAEALKTPRPLPVRANLRERMAGKDTTELRLKGGREEQIYLQDTAIDELIKHEPKPTHFIGSLVLRDGENREVARQGITYLAGASPARLTNATPAAKPASDERGEIDKLTDALYDSRLAFVRSTRGNTDAGVVARRTELLAALRAERPGDAATVFEQALDAAVAARLASDFWPKAKSSAEAAGSTPVAEPAAAVLALLDSARKLAGPEAVAQHFGAPPAVPAGDAAARAALERDKKRFTTQRETLAAIERLRADVLRATAQTDAAWRAFAEIKRWEPEPADKLTRALEARLFEQAGHLGLALEVLNGRIRDEPADLALREQRAALYEQLGWGEAAAQERLRLARLANQRRIVQSW